MKYNIPNILTLLRILLIPVFVLVFFLPVKWSNETATGIFALAALTDWLDGYLARRLGQTSSFGAFLDPVADKLMVAVALILLVHANPTPFSGSLLAIATAVIIGREIAISALREWMAELGNRAKVAVSIIGKIKTTAQMIAILLLLYRDPIGQFATSTVGFVLLIIAAGLTIWSMFIYLRAAWPIIAATEENEAEKSK
jgi:CDP-diacylglycerol--glycerol-3-phosphate 3-phosphatidyltransferase